MKTASRGRVCFFSSYLWPNFSERAIPFAGGAETQQALLVRGLAATGFEVSVATCDYGQGRRVVREGITFHATHPPFSGIPVLRFFHPRLTGNLRALLASKAEVYYVRGSGMQAGLAYDVARFTGAALVFAAAHDHDAHRDLPLVELARDRWWFRRAIAGAGAVIAQTSHQREMFLSEWGRESTVIPNLVELPARTADASRGGAVLWLSTYKDVKRPGWMIELARRHAHLRFVMAGVIPPPPLTSEVFEEIRATAAALPNLEVRGHVEHHALADFLGQGALFLHTSPVEGFPNTLLEAWAHGLPSMSVVDPDGIVAREGLGEVTPDLDTMSARLGEWMASPDARRGAGARARRYVEAHHAPEAITARVGVVLDEVVKKVRRR